MLQTGSSMMLLPLVAPLREAGVDLMAFWREHRIDVRDLASPTARIESACIVSAWDGALAVTGDENFGLRAAERYEHGMFHVLDYLVANAATLGDALEQGRARLRLLHDLAQIDRELEGELCTVTLSSSAGGILPRAQADFFIACLVLVARMLSGVSAAPTRVRLPHAAPADSRPARALFHCDIEYDASSASVVFPAFFLQQSCAKADPNLLRVVSEHADLLLAQLPQTDPLLVRVRARIAEQLRSDASVQSVARSVGMSPRTLRRRLTELSTSFQELRDNLRIEMARRLLRDSRLSLEEVADALGFSSAQSFARSFRRAAGESPSQYRRGGDGH